MQVFKGLMTGCCNAGSTFSAAKLYPKATAFIWKQTQSSQSLCLTGTTQLNSWPAMSFARNFTRGRLPPLNMPKATSSKKKATAGLDDDDETMQKINRMMGVHQSYQHLLPEMRSVKDFDKLFGSFDQLEMTDKD